LGGGFWVWGVGLWAQPPNPQSPIPNPQSPIPRFLCPKNKINYLLNNKILMIKSYLKIIKNLIN